MSSEAGARPPPPPSLSCLCEQTDQACTDHDSVNRFAAFRTIADQEKVRTRPSLVTHACTHPSLRYGALRPCPTLCTHMGSQVAAVKAIAAGNKDHAISATYISLATR